jgi:hypothetical protein
MPKAKKAPLETPARLPGQWDSRIVGHGRVAPDQLVANPNNFRTHPQAQRDALRDAISEIGFLKSVTVNKRSGNLIDGHERVWQALKTDQPWIDVEYVDLSDAEEKLALATLDPIAAMARMDKEALDLLLQDVATGSEALQAMLAELAEDAGIMPGDAAERAEPVPVISFNLVFDDEDQQQAWFNFMRALKEKYPDGPTHAARLTSFIQESGMAGDG